MVGDLTGFAAAGFLRGVRFIQLPTTLLSQVDSSVGGKTGINHPLGKNLIGAFHQPSAVVIDLDTLASLPDRGSPPVWQRWYGCIYAPDFYSWLMANASELAGRDQTVVAEAIARSCIKARVVAQDEREGGLRAILNFGHTFGHAIEKEMGYGSWLHGEAVACGMVIAARISARRGWVPDDDDRPDRFPDCLRLAHLAPEAMSADVFLEAMALDKKVAAGKVRYVLLRALGTAILVDNARDEIALAILDRDPKPPIVPPQGRV